MEQKETDDFHLRGPQPQESPGAEALPLSDSGFLSSVVVVVVVVFTGVGRVSRCVQAVCVDDMGVKRALPVS